MSPTDSWSTARTSSMPQTHLLEREQCFAIRRDDLFHFFADAGNLSAITPEFLQFRILTPLPLEMTAGAQIDYRLGLYGLPVRWRTRIESFAPPTHFVDRQVGGPYRLWHHTHSFEDIDGGTRMRDVVRYRLRYGPLGTIAHALMIRRTLRRIFDYRAQALREIFGAAPLGAPLEAGRLAPRT